MNDNNIIDIDKFRAAQNSLRASETSPGMGRSAGDDIASSGVPSTRERRNKEQNADQVPNYEDSKPINIKKSGKLLNAAMIDILKWLRPEQCREYPIAQRVQSEDSPPYLLQPSSKREPYLPANKPRSVFRAKAPRKGRRLSKRRVNKGRSNATIADERVSIPLLLAQNIRCHCLPPERVIPTPHQREIAPHLQVIYTPLQCA